MAKWDYYYWIGGDSFLPWAITMLIGAVLTPIWIIMAAFGIDWEF